MAATWPSRSRFQPLGTRTVLVIDEQNPGRLKLNDQPCDRRVAGVVSGFTLAYKAVFTDGTQGIYTMPL